VLVLEVVGPENMTALGAAVGAACRSGDVIALVGDLGAGKTVFAKGLALGLDVPADVPVVSPTFTIVNHHLGGRLPLAHVDLYRLEKPEELEHVGLWDLYRGDGVVAVEWFDRFADMAPREFLELRIEPLAEDRRQITALGHGPAGARLLAAIAAFKEKA
jgi:tRNA threonylcarbamoyladenosine biosynthesis protein TsaE